MKFILSLPFIALFPLGSALANGVQENVAWQFQTTAELANRAYIEDMRLKRTTGFYSTPQYNTYITSQYNCSLAANASGNGGSNSASANSANAAGPSSNATGNSSGVTLEQPGQSFDTILNNGQANDGFVFSDAYGEVLSGANGNMSYQVLNTAQDNSGVQDASINGSSGCAFAPGN